MSNSNKTILLTGASGVVGQAILEKLTDTTVICLVHRTPVEGQNIVSLTGDISLPHLGLSADQFDNLSGQIDYIVHSAAATSFGETREFTYRTNLEGTRNVLELANQAGVPICHISTAFAHLESLDSAHQSNAYESSKFEAEELVRQSGVPYVILRPSVVIGDSNDGSMSRFQGFHFLCDLMVRGTLPVWLPTTPAAYIDFIPQDAVANVVAACVSRAELRGEYWLTSGERALQVEQAVTLWEQHIPRLTGKTIKRPRYVDPDIVDRLLRPVFLPSLPARTQMMVNQALELLSFSIEDTLPSSLTELEATLGTHRMPDPELCLIRNAEFWAWKRGFLQTAQLSRWETGAKPAHE